MREAPAQRPFTSVAELIRNLIRALIKPSSKKEQNAMDALAELRKQFIDVNPEQLIQEIISAQRDIRHEKKVKSGR